MSINRIGILTGGGDCPGLNAVIRAVTKTSLEVHGWQVTGILDGYEGLILNKTIKLESSHVSNILAQGGTILGTSNTANPFAYAVKKNGKIVMRDLSKRTLANIKKMKLDALVAIGGDGSLTIAHLLMKQGVPVVGVPKTIDNDLVGTELTFGHDTAVQIISDALDRLHTTAQSHHRIMVLEVMGRYAGWLALRGALAGGGDIVLIPEIPFSFDKVVRAVHERRRRGKKFSLIVVAEGATAHGHTMVVERLVEGSPDPVRLGGIGKTVADHLEQATGISTRYTVLGHIQRGGTPTAVDRLLGTNLGVHAVQLLAARRFGRMVAIRNGALGDIPLENVAGRVKTVPKDHPLVIAARGLGLSFGDGF